MKKNIRIYNQADYFDEFNDERSIKNITLSSIFNQMKSISSNYLRQVGFLSLKWVMIVNRFFKAIKEVYHEIVNHPQSRLSVITQVLGYSLAIYGVVSLTLFLEKGGSVSWLPLPSGLALLFCNICIYDLINKISMTSAQTTPEIKKDIFKSSYDFIKAAQSCLSKEIDLNDMDNQHEEAWKLNLAFMLRQNAQDRSSDEDKYIFSIQIKLGLLSCGLLFYHYLLNGPLIFYPRMIGILLTLLLCKYPEAFQSSAQKTSLLKEILSLFIQQHSFSILMASFSPLTAVLIMLVVIPASNICISAISNSLSFLRDSPSTIQEEKIDDCYTITLTQSPHSMSITLEYDGEPSDMEESSVLKIMEFYNNKVKDSLNGTIISSRSRDKLSAAQLVKEDLVARLTDQGIGVNKSQPAPDVQAIGVNQSQPVILPQVQQMVLSRSRSRSRSCGDLEEAKKATSVRPRSRSCG